MFLEILIHLTRIATNESLTFFKKESKRLHSTINDKVYAAKKK